MGVDRTGIETVAAIVGTVISGTDVVLGELVAAGSEELVAVGTGELVAVGFGVRILEVLVGETDGEELGVS